MPLRIIRWLRRGRRNCEISGKGKRGNPTPVSQTPEIDSGFPSAGAEDVESVWDAVGTIEHIRQYELVHHAKRQVRFEVMGKDMALLTSASS